MKIFKTKKYSILSGILRYSFVIIFGFYLINNLAIAAVCPDGSIRSVCPDGVSSTNPDGSIGNGEVDGSIGGTEINTKINNPLGEDGPQTITDFINLIVRAVIVIGIPIVALAIIYTGFLFVKAQGNAEALGQAKRSLLYTLIGGLLLLGAFVIANAIGRTVEDITSTT